MLDEKLSPEPLLHPLPTFAQWVDSTTGGKPTTILNRPRRIPCASRHSVQTPARQRRCCPPTKWRSFLRRDSNGSLPDRVSRLKASFHGYHRHILWPGPLSRRKIPGLVQLITSCLAFPYISDDRPDPSPTVPIGTFHSLKRSNTLSAIANCGWLLQCLSSPPRSGSGVGTGVGKKVHETW